MLDIHPSEIPEGSDYQWAAKSVAGDESLGDVVRMKKTGWRPVPKTRHPKLKSADPKHIEYGGLVLMERPRFLTEKAKEWEQNKADAQVVSALRAMHVASDPWLSEGRVSVQTTRQLNWNADPVRRTSIKEFFVRHFWQVRVWFRNIFQIG